MDKKQFANNVRRLREENTLTQEQLAEASGISLRTIQRIEGAEVTPRSDTIIMLANALNVSPAQLADWSVKENKKYLASVNISGVTALAFPILGIILPLILWFNGRDNIAGLETTSKKVINFQITWLIIFFMLLPLIMIRIIMALRNGEISEATGPEGALMFVLTSGALLLPLWVLYNVIMCIINFNRARKGKKEVYFPSIPFLKY